MKKNDLIIWCGLVGVLLVPILVSYIERRRRGAAFPDFSKHSAFLDVRRDLFDFYRITKGGNGLFVKYVIQSEDLRENIQIKSLTADSGKEFYIEGQKILTVYSDKISSGLENSVLRLEFANGEVGQLILNQNTKAFRCEVPGLHVEIQTKLESMLSMTGATLTEKGELLAKCNYQSAFNRTMLMCVRKGSTPKHRALCALIAIWI